MKVTGHVNMNKGSAEDDSTKMACSQGFIDLIVYLF